MALSCLAFVWNQQVPADRDWSSVGANKSGVSEPLPRVRHLLPGALNQSAKALARPEIEIVHDGEDGGNVDKT